METDAPAPVDEVDGTPLVKVLIEYLDQDAENTERVWAKPLGGDLYEIRNTPWFVYKLNWGDVVRCAEVSPAEVPRVLDVERRSGHRTLRIIFERDEVPPEDQEPLLEKLNELQAFYERYNDVYIAVDVEPQADYDAVFDFLADLTNKKLLIFEEAWRDDGLPGFGPAPEEDEGEH